MRFEFRPEQRVWHRRRAAAGERSWLLLQVQKTQEWVLLSGARAAILVGSATQEQLMAEAAAVWEGKRFDKEFEAWLQQVT